MCVIIVAVLCTLLSQTSLSANTIEDVDSCSESEFYCSGQCFENEYKCDGVRQCDDGRDEANCTRSRRALSCILPEDPENGFFTTNIPYATPGQSFPTILLNATCHPGYRVQGNTDALCYQGNWLQPIPQCVRGSTSMKNDFCELNKHPSVRYHCLVQGSIVGHRACRSYEPSGTIVHPECNSPNYYSAEILPFMRCNNGRWDYVARCSPECGRITPDGAMLIAGGRQAKRGELPWHTAIYKKTFTPYMQICGGSLVTNTVIISAAHCFFVDYQLPASEYAAAIGKLHRPFTDVADDEIDSQKSDVKDIKIPDHYQGRKANFQDDIALVYLAHAFVYQTHVRPVCLSFDYDFDRRQLVRGNVGKVAGWGLTSRNGPASPVLNVVKLPYVDTSYCIARAPPGFSEYITGDKICAGFERRGTAVCQGDSGGGLVFSEQDRGVERYYLRGIVSTAPDDENLCNVQTITTFTHIIKHEHFIKQNLYNPLISDTCSLPLPPAFGSYTSSVSQGSTGQYFPSLRLSVTCRPGFRVLGNSEIDCVAGLWSETMPKCVRDLRQGDECKWNDVVGTCVEPHRCLTSLDKTEEQAVCSGNGESIKICCTDCVLISDINKAVVSPRKEEGVFWKDGRKARDQCLQYLEKLPHQCRLQGLRGGVKRVYDADKQCHGYQWSGDKTNASEVTNPIQYPFLALLGYGDNLANVVWRGDVGIIISDKYVLTTAWRSTEPHNGGLKFLAMGVTNRTGSRDNWIIHEIKSHAVHPGYIRNGFYNDVALLETKKTIKFNEKVLPACLPSEEFVDNEAVLPTYWYTPAHSSIDTIRTVRVQKHTEEECSRSYGNYNHTTQVCYGHRQDYKESCDSWSGDPLIVTNHISSCMSTVIGIRWAGASCSVPDCHTMITHYVPWIESVVWP